MHEIICPHCGKAFKIDEAGYADILKQVREKQFPGLGQEEGAQPSPEQMQAQVQGLSGAVRQGSMLAVISVPSGTLARTRTTGWFASAQIRKRPNPSPR